MTVRFSSLLLGLTLSLAALAAQTAQPPGSDQLYTGIRSGDNGRLGALLRSGANANARERRSGATPLMHAAAIGSIDAMKLLIDSGAEVNARSSGGATALMWAAADLAKVRLLLERGADVNAVSETGRSALHLVAMSDQSADVVRLLLARGADARATDKEQMTTVLAGAVGNDTDTIRQLVAAGANVNTSSIFGNTPLMAAAGQGNHDAVTLLLASGADVNAVAAEPGGRVKNGIVALGRFTPLILGSAYGPVEIVKALIDAGADVNATEARGMTPLVYSVATDHGDLEIVKMLIARGARLDMKTLGGETALDWAQKAGQTPAVAVLERAGAKATPRAPAPPPAASPTTARAAVERSVTLLERMAAAYFPNGGCGACHAQNITDVAVKHARRAGIRVDAAAVAQRSSAAAATFASTATRLFERFDGPALDIPLYAMLALDAAGHAADRATDAMVFNIVVQQQREGHWNGGGVPRPPMGDGNVSRTALAVRAIKAYGLPARGAEMNERAERAVAWLQSSTPHTAEDHSFRLLGLKWGGAAAGVVQRSTRYIVALQRADGGWAQRTEMGSDAYATGLTLVALMESGGLTSANEAVRRGAQFLVSTQRADGSWYVRSRSPKFQPYFDGGLPYEHDQWISAMATGWATTALAGTLSEPSGATR